MTTKSTTVKKPAAKKRVKIVNESRLVLPQDIGGFSSNFRREAARSIGRISADPKKLECFLKQLEIFAQYATDRHENEVEVRAAQVAAKAKKLIAAEQEAINKASAIINTKRQEAARLNADIARHDAMVAKSA